MGKARSAPDIWIIIPTLLLLTIGVIMVYSASSVLAFREFGDSFYYLKRQFIFAVLGVIAMFFTMNVDYLVWKRFAKIALIYLFWHAGYRVDSRYRGCSRRGKKLARDRCFRDSTF